VLTIALVYFITYWILSRSGAIVRFFGKTGTKVAIRIMGLMLLSIAMQFIIDGLSEAFPKIGR
jgi:multiple antibiotic resistance protein